MFGFPTQVKVLYTRFPTIGREPDTLDRDSDIAVSEFAPGSEIVKDKAIHTAIGVVDFYQRPNGGWAQGDDPLGDPFPAGLCSSCLAISLGQAATCATCGSGAPAYRHLDLVQPAAYRTSFRPRNYAQLSEPTSRAGQPRLALEATEARSVENAVVRSANAEVFVTNDNNGGLYQFAPATRTWEGVPRPEAGLVEAGFLRDRERAKRAKRANVWVTQDGPLGAPVAISARRRTDVLAVGLSKVPPGLRIDPRTPQGRGAWASLGYLLQGAAVRWLDIGSDEIEVGVHPKVIDRRVDAELFLADSLENGAGYARRLGDGFEALLAEATKFAQQLFDHAGTSCDSSCYTCLRDYSNSQWHPLLDWRIAVDMLDLLRGATLNFDRQRGRDNKAAEAFAGDFGLTVDLAGAVPVVHDDRGRSLAFLHPLESLDGTSSSNRVLSVKKRYPHALMASTFDLIRRPGHLAGAS